MASSEQSSSGQAHFELLSEYTVHPALQDFVSRIRLIRYKLDHKQSRPLNPFPPQPEHSLYFYLHDKVICHNVAKEFIAPLPASIVVGPQTSLVNLSIGHNTEIIHVGFLPGGLYRLLGIPMQDLLGRAFDSTLFLNRDINEAIQRTHEMHRDLSKVQVVEQLLLSKVNKLKRALPIDQVLKNVLSHSNLPTIDVLASEACVSVRQLERQFLERIGTSPKVFMRTIRFSRAWNMRERNPDISWSEIAHASMYVDHMHMIRDFKLFTQTVPSQLQRDLDRSPLRLQAIMSHLI